MICIARGTQHDPPQYVEITACNPGLRDSGVRDRHGVCTPLAPMALSGAVACPHSRTTTGLRIDGRASHGCYSIGELGNR